MAHLGFGGKRIISFFLAFSVLFFLLRLFSVNTSAADLDEAAERMKDGFFAMEESIDISQYEITPEILGSLFSSIIKNEPYLFFVHRNLSYSYESDGFVLSVKPKYTMSREEVASAIAFCREKVLEMTNGACGGEAERTLYLHDLICNRFEYDDSLENDNIYDFFITGKGTCQGYTLAYMAVLRECGIESCFAASDTIAHIWNLVKIDGEWYHADLTWDDGESVIRRHFLLSDTTALERGHRDWYSAKDISCVSDNYLDADFDKLSYTSAGSGDADHNGECELLDLLNIRAGGDICKKCADIDRDGEAEEEDAELLRQKLIFEDY